MNKSNFIFFSALNQCNARMIKRLEGRLGSLHGLGVSEFLALHYLNSAETQLLSRTNLAQQVGLTVSGVTRLLIPMEKIGLVAKQANERDARKSMVKLTSAGKNTLEAAYISFDEVMDGVLSALNDKEREGALALFAKLA